MTNLRALQPPPLRRGARAGVPIEDLPDLVYQPHLAVSPCYDGDWPGLNIVAFTAVYPRKERARQELKNAIRRGEVARPSTCSGCGKTCVPQGHHVDYLRPLEVQWLCQGCHASKHPHMSPRVQPMPSRGARHRLARWLARWRRPVTIDR